MMIEVLTVDDSKFMRNIIKKSPGKRRVQGGG